MTDFVEELTNEIEVRGDRDEDKVSELLASCPHLRVVVGERQMRALLDLGSQISAMSESFYKELPLKGEIKELPVTNFVVLTAIEKKSTTIKRQIFIQIQVENMTTESSFFVVPYLTSEIILSHDWLSRNKVIMDYNRKIITMQGRELTETSVMFGCSAEETIICTRRNDTVYVYVIEANIINARQKDEPIASNDVGFEEDRGGENYI